MFTAAQAAQKLTAFAVISPLQFTAAQAAQKKTAPSGHKVGPFTAAQAAQKIQWISDSFG